MSHRATCFALALGLSACASAPRSVSTACPSSDGVASERRAAACESAIEAAEAASIRVADYRLVSAVEESDGAWTLMFEHVDPAPPGGHFGARVDRAGHAVVLRGE